MKSEIRVRFAPSPTGLLHIGGLRTALYNFLFARRHGGTFVLRIEDTDQARYVNEAEQDILESLAWAGLHPDEGPVVISTDEKISDADAVGGHVKKVSRIDYDIDVGLEKGTFGPYHQSRRRERYARYARQLVDAGYAYYAYDSVEEIERMRDRLRTTENPTPKYDSQTRIHMKNSLTLSESEIQKMVEDGVSFVVRLKVPEGEKVTFDDLVRGPVSFETDGLDDQVLLKADGMPTYHLANVVDDHEMKITHVIRGEEWLSSAPKHILLYRYLGWEAPAMAHLPLIMSPSGGKLSKRKAEEEGIPVNVRDYRSNRYERDAVVNFLALLGWSPGDDRERLTLDEMVEEFSLDRVGKSGSIFDFNKLLWFNEHYLREQSDVHLAEELKVLIEKRDQKGETAASSTTHATHASSLSSTSAEPASPASSGIPDDTAGWMPPSEELKKRAYETEYLTGVVRLLKERVSRLPEFLEAGRLFFETPVQYDEKALKKGWKTGTPALVSGYLARISEFDTAAFHADALKQALTDAVEEEGVGFGKLMMPLRIAVTGTGSGPDLFQTLELLGKEEVERRIHLALTLLENGSET